MSKEGHGDPTVIPQVPGEARGLVYKSKWRKEERNVLKNFKEGKGYQTVPRYFTIIITKYGVILVHVLMSPQYDLIMMV